MESKNLSVNPGMDDERIDIGKQRIQKIGAEPGLLLFVERESKRQVFAGGGQNLNLHNRRSRSSFLAFSQST